VVVKVYYSSDEEDNTISLNTTQTDLLKKAKKWKRYDKNKQERIFEIKYSDGKVFTFYKKMRLKM